MKKIAIVFFFFLFISSLSFGHSRKAKYHVIVDTDAAADDMRAISMLLASPEIEIIAITVSDGALPPHEGLLKVRALLAAYGHQGVLTAAGVKTQDELPEWYPFSSEFNWGNEAGINTHSELPAADLIVREVMAEDKPVIMLCLGSMKNLSDALEQNSGITEKIERIVWYNETPQPEAGVNYGIAPQAATNVYAQNWPIEVVSNTGNNAPFFDTDFLNRMETLPTLYARQVALAHREKPEHLAEGKFKFWDDLVAVYLTDSTLFQKQVVENKIVSITVKDTATIVQQMLVLYAMEQSDESIVFEGFPSMYQFFRADVAEVMPEIYHRHGREEWRIAVLTNELHGHLGIYDIVGAKMGLRARQYFNVAVDELQVLSFAGSRPPISCLNDGLQFSTGATVGHGTIAVADNDTPRPQAEFQFKDRRIRMTLKQKYWEQIKTDIRAGIQQHGNLTADYWNYVRELSLRYWLEWSRYEIFTIAPAVSSD